MITLNPLERRVLRALADADRRWLRAIEVAEDLAHELRPVQSALSRLRRAELVRVQHRSFSACYAISTLGEAALDRLGHVEVGR